MKPILKYAGGKSKEINNYIRLIVIKNNEK